MFADLARAMTAAGSLSLLDWDWDCDPALSPVNGVTLLITVYSGSTIEGIAWIETGIMENEIERAKRQTMTFQDQGGVSG